MAGKGRKPCCDKSKVKKGPWSPAEDIRLRSYVQKNGLSNWRSLPQKAGLPRCGKSCRLRWINYLRPDVKRGKFSREEEDTILRLHQTVGNKWSKIASNLPGRTDNDIKNVWNTYLKKRRALTIGDSSTPNEVEAHPFAAANAFSFSSSNTIKQPNAKGKRTIEMGNEKAKKARQDTDLLVVDEDDQELENEIAPTLSPNNSIATTMNCSIESGVPNLLEEEIDTLLMDFNLLGDNHEDGILLDFLKEEDKTTNVQQNTVEYPFMDPCWDDYIMEPNELQTYIDETTKSTNEISGEVDKRWVQYLETELGFDDENGVEEETFSTDFTTQQTGTVQCHPQVNPEDVDLDMNNFSMGGSSSPNDSDIWWSKQTRFSG